MGSNALSYFGSPKRHFQTLANEKNPLCGGRGPTERLHPFLLPFGSPAGLAHVTAAAVAELGNRSGDAGRRRVHSRGSRSEARVVKKPRGTELIEANEED